MSAQFQVLAQPPSLPPILRVHSPTTTTTTLHAPPHQPYTPFPVAVDTHPTPLCMQTRLISHFTNSSDISTYQILIGDKSEHVRTIQSCSRVNYALANI